MASSWRVIQLLLLLGARSLLLAADLL
jgi:hypothetical protein